MADRRFASGAGACRTDCSSAISLIGRLAGDRRSAAVCGTKENPVIAPPALRLTSAVACCHQGLPRGRNRDLLTGDDGGLPNGKCGAYAGDRAPCSDLRIARTRGSPGFFAFWNSTAAFWAAPGPAPTTHFW